MRARWRWHALFDQQGWLVGCDRRAFTATVAADLAHMFEHTDLHRHDIDLLAGFFANQMLAATTGAGLLVLGQVADDFDTLQVSLQRFAFATAYGRGNEFFLGLLSGSHPLTFGLDRLLGFAVEQAIPQQLDLFFQVDDVGGIGVVDVLLAQACFVGLKQHLLE